MKYDIMDNITSNITLNDYTRIVDIGATSCAAHPSRMAHYASCGIA